MRAKAIFLGLVSLICFEPDGVLALSPDLIELKNLHQASVGSINTLQLKLRVRYDPPLPEGAEIIHYWLNADEYRLKVFSKSGSQSEYHAKDGVIKALNYLPSIKGSVPTHSGRIIPEGGPIYGDPMGLCLLTVPGATKFYVSLETLLSEPHRFNGIKQVSELGRDYSVLEIKHDRAKLEIWLSEKHNFLVGKLVIWDLAGSKDPIGITVVDQFTEVCPGIYFPAKATNVRYDVKNGKIINTRTVVVEETKINHPLEMKDMAFNFPANLMVMDMVQGKIWTTDSQGKLGSEAKGPDGKPLTLAKGANPPALPPGAIPNPPPIGAIKTATQEEPPSPTRWILPISMALILCGFSLLLLQKLRKNQAR